VVLVGVGIDGDIGDEDFELFEYDGFMLVLVVLFDEVYECFYEGFFNVILWLFYYDVVVKLLFYCEWWDVYVEVNYCFVLMVVCYVVEDVIVWV